MIACLRLLTALCLAALLAACASSPSSSLGELPRTPDASIEQLLEKAASSKSAEDAALLRLSAADHAPHAFLSKSRWTHSSRPSKCSPAPSRPSWP
jgi:uncharacterized protein